MIVGAEGLAEIVIVRIAKAFCDINDLIVLVCQQFLGAFHAQFQDILVDGETVLVAE